MIRISTDNTCHVVDHKAIYEKKFFNVMNYHDGVAAVRDSEGAYHIDLNGNAIYDRKFLKTFGYYEDLAAVVDDSGAYHIDLKGNPAYDARFLWTGNFQEGRCPVRCKDGKYGSIDHNGVLHIKAVSYIGDYFEGKAIVRGPEGCTYAGLDEISENSVWHIGCTDYCEGIAYVSDSSGYRPIDTTGNSVAGEGFDRIIRFDRERLTVVKDGNLIDNGRKVMKIGACNKPGSAIPSWIGFVESGCWDSCAVFLRHGDRSASAQSDSHTVESKLLTEKGIRTGQEIGKHITSCHISLKAYSSPVKRCISTAELLVGNSVPVTLTDVLGLPGTAFICDNRASDKTDRLPLMDFAIRHISGGDCPGWNPVPDAAENILSFLNGDLQVDGRLTLCVSHDAFLARLVGIFMQEYPQDRWFGFYDGVVIFRKNGALYAWYDGRVVKIPEDLHSVKVKLTGYRNNDLEWTSAEHEGIRTFRDTKGKYGFLMDKGYPISCERFDYAGDMKYSLAVVGVEGKGFTYLTDLGQYPIDRWFIECTPFHKGFATARDEKGWYHMDQSGKPVYGQRYAYAEPFYNEVALCRDLDGNWCLVRQDGSSEIIIEAGGAE